ncbi:decaprenyl-diphosphate synthase subunit 1 [Lasius niger]|uniref:Decaprenyl-diphosphate synthase subunit 1 n=1 Tax=Lasius niger TaxID=67767 RepID=A0A0J7L651_LASNI|nr:decaprenyl-diphosphate synthase subunit 1 [Lasius niger]
MQTQMPGSLPDYQIDPYRLAEDDLKDMFDDIRLVAMAGDYILAVACRMLSKLQNDDVTVTVSQVAILAEVDDHMVEMAFQYGRNVGLAFQLVDDLLDFVASSEALGKPTAADLKLGLATAPVLFACERYPELNVMIMRRFQEHGDVEKAFELVHKSNGLEQTRFLAKKHCAEANKIVQSFAKSPYQKALSIMADLVINRMK